MIDVIATPEMSVFANAVLWLWMAGNFPLQKVEGPDQSVNRKLLLARLAVKGR